MRVNRKQDGKKNKTREIIRFKGKKLTYEDEKNKYQRENSGQKRNI